MNQNPQTPERPETPTPAASPVADATGEGRQDPAPGAGAAPQGGGTAGIPGFEIERRFLVRIEDHSWEVKDIERRFLRQGYIRAGDPAIRIRMGEPRGPVLTCKSGKGVKRHEVETVVAEEMAAELFEASEDRVIEKIRWRIGPWELDRFVGRLEGLFLLEIELDHEDAPIPEPPPGIRILREVTDDKRFTSSYLASMKPRKQAKLVKKVYKEVKGWKGLAR